MLFVTFFISLNVINVRCFDWSSINLPSEHLPYYFNSFPDVSDQCKKSPECPFKAYTNTKKCWGYEANCDKSERFSTAECPGDHRGWVKSKKDQEDVFYTQADFGFVKQKIQDMKVVCEALFAHDSSLECSHHLQFCRGRNLMINFTNLQYRNEPLRYKTDVLKAGEIGGYCEFHKRILEKQADQISALQSWGPEMRNFARLNKRPLVEGSCDVIIEKPTFIMKIDATVNMYHHFCDFVNLYASLHLNATHPDAFSTDVHILIWESYTYRSAFESTFDAFTEYPIWDLKTFRGKTVCFKNIVFPLLPRMIYGLYYNTPIIYGCQNSGLFKAFSQHVLHRLRIPLHQRKDRRIRITLLSRDTKYRRILNENQLVETISSNPDYVVQKVVFTRDFPFKKQLEITRNTDVLIGIHGAGLTHMLFMPIWGAVFELYNCEDASCYLDLSRLKGLKYITWEKPEKLSSEEDGSYDGGAHAKFANYRFDPEEFERLVKKAAIHVQNHVEFLNSIQNSKHEEL